MSLSETIKDIEQELKKEVDETPSLVLVPNENSKAEGEQIMRYVQEMRRKSWEIAGNFL